MQGFGHFFSRTDFPYKTILWPSGQLGGPVSHSPDIDHRVASENLGQSVGQIAGKAGVAALVQFKEKVKPICCGLAQGKPDIIGTVFCSAKQSFKKFIRPFGWKKSVEPFRGKSILGHGRSFCMRLPAFLDSPLPGLGR